MSDKSDTTVPGALSDCKLHKGDMEHSSEVSQRGSGEQSKC